MDNAFKTAAYPGLTTAQLEKRLRDTQERAERADTTDAYMQDMAIIDKMSAELDRRERVAAGDVSAMTAGERLRHYKAEAGL